MTLDLGNFSPDLSADLIELLTDNQQQLHTE